MLARIAERVAGKADLAVVVIPTKESVYAPRVIQRSSDVPRAFTELIAAENAVRARITELLDARGIPWVDALPAMRRALDVQPERPLYPEGWDGHPAPAGHEAIASAVATLQPRDTRSNAATPRSSDPEASAARLSGRSS